MRKRKVAKALEGSEKTAFLAQRTVDTVDEWYALEDAHELARMGMRYSLISELTGYNQPPMPYMVKAEAASMDRGMVPVEVGQLTFSIDVNIKHLGEVLKRAAEHKGTAFVEIYQNCKDRKSVV